MDLNAPDAPQFASATARVDAKKAGLRIQEALPGMFPEVLPSRKSCRKALDRGDILLNGVVADTARRVQIGDTVTLNVALQPPTPPGKGNPTQFQWHRPPDADYLFVWKPAGLSTSGVGNRHLAGTLAHLAHAGTPAQRTDLRPHQPDALRWPQPVHRLDRVTAGWVCIALTLSTAQSLGQAFAERTVHKKYLALVAGNPENAGQSTAPLDDKAAATRWKVLGTGPLPVHGTAALIEATPETGRTHQIRRHLALAGHAIVGEHLYQPDQTDGQPGVRYTGQGLFLSATSLALPAGTHGPARSIAGPPPRKFYAVPWVRALLSIHGAQATEAS